MAKPQPVRYCPIEERDHVPARMMEQLPAYQAQFMLQKLVKTNLCQSCAHAQIACDPLICEPKLVDAYEFACSTDKPVNAFAGACKRIYREYAVAASKEQEQMTMEWRLLGQGLLDGD